MYCNVMHVILSKYIHIEGRMCIDIKQIIMHISERKKKGEKCMRYLIVRREDKLKDDHQPDKSWLGVMKTKCHEELFSTNQDSKKEETQEGVHL